MITRSHDDDRWTTPRNEGYQAALNGDPINPFRAGSQGAWEWEAGYQEATAAKAEWLHPYRNLSADPIPCPHCMGRTGCDCDTPIKGA